MEIKTQNTVNERRLGVRLDITGSLWSSDRDNDVLSCQHT